MESNVIKRATEGKFVLIGEIGVNYYDIATKENISPLEAAKLMVREAKEAGLHAVKFQSYKAETLAAKQSPSYWDTTEEATTSQYELFKKFDGFSEKEYRELWRYCNEIGIEFMSTAFDIASADYLYDMMGAYKISSSDLNNLPFVEYQAKKGKPIILSVGASKKEEIATTLKTIRENNREPIVLMHCILEYPTPYEDANLNRIVSLKKEFGKDGVYIGYSDHTKPDGFCDVVKTAYNLGATVVEKHFTLDKTLKGNDHYHAMDTEDARRILSGVEFIDKIRGSYEIKFLESEEISRKNARRSLVTARAIAKGEAITKEALTFKRPGTGISPSEIEKVVGRKAKEDIGEDTVLTEDMLEK